MEERAGRPIVGTAGWTIPRAVANRFGEGSSGLARYATRFGGVEINTTFYRPQQAKTFERWAATTPDGFRFALKAPKAITHEAKLVDVGPAIAAFLEQITPLGEKRGPILFQLPPSLAFDPAAAARFLGELRRLHHGPVALEPRHPSWFDEAPDRLLAENEVARVAADPPRAPTDGTPGGWTGLTYWRLHGSPRLYYSAYDDEWLASLAQAIAAKDAWCVFDNTASGAAAADALRLGDRLNPEGLAGIPSP